jgi:hypothetical protein
MGLGHLYLAGSGVAADRVVGTKLTLLSSHLDIEADERKNDEEESATEEKVGEVIAAKEQQDAAELAREQERQDDLETRQQIAAAIQQTGQQIDATVAQYQANRSAASAATAAPPPPITTPPPGGDFVTRPPLDVTRASAASDCPSGKDRAHEYICMGPGKSCGGTTPCCTDECEDNDGRRFNPSNDPTLYLTCDQKTRTCVGKTPPASAPAASSGECATYADCPAIAYSKEGLRKICFKDAWLSGAKDGPSRCCHNSTVICRTNSECCSNQCVRGFCEWCTDSRGGHGVCSHYEPSSP